MSARYLLRFDDICPTMNWKVWRKIETALLAYQIKPLLALVPDNRDPQLCVAPAHENFWDEARRWQSMGWTIGLHGYQHLYVTDNAGLLGLNARSEFAGLSFETQAEKISNALAIFKREQITPQIWIAPAHAFDAVTLAVLQQQGLRVISDGFFFYPHRDAQGMQWVPQQLWRFRRLPFGVWTICLHHNHWTEAVLEDFLQMLAKQHAAFHSLETVLRAYPQRTPAAWDRLVATAWPYLLRIKRRLAA